MSKIIKPHLIYILAFFIFGAFLPKISNAQDTKTLENGLRIIVKEDHRNPIVVCSVFIDVGAASEGRYSGSGISHLIEHMLFKGTQKYPPRAIEDILHKYGGKIEGFTSYDYTGFRVTILKEHLDIALDVLKEMLTSPTFNTRELEKEMQVIEREIDLGRDDPGKRIARLTFSNAYIRHPYSLPVIGHRENFRELDRQGLLDFFKSNYTSERIVIAVVGDIDRETVSNKIENIFGKMRRGKNAFLALPVEPAHIAESYTEEKQDIDGAYLSIAFHSTDLLDKDLYALDLLSFVLGQGESSRLNEGIRIKKKLVLSTSAYNYTPKDPGLFIISSVLKEENVKNAIDEIMEEILSVKQKGVTEEELLKAKNNFLAEHIYQKETVESQANNLALGELLTGDPHFFELYTEYIKSVTLDDVQRVANKYLTRENMTVVVLSKSGNTLKLSSESVEQKEKREIEKITLKNNLPVIISEDPALPILSISLLFKGGVMLETEEDNGISKITSLMIMDGLDSMTRKEIAWFYESRGMSIGTYSGNNSLGISVNCLKGYTEDALKLLSNLCINSIFPEEELEREKDELVSAIDMQDNQVFVHGHRLLKELLFKTHPYGFQVIGRRESIDKIKREDVTSFYRNVFSVDNMVLGICGDCKIEEVKMLVEKYFSDIPLRKRDRNLPAKETPIDGVRELLINTDKEQSLVLVGFHGTDIYSKERYAVEVMVDTLSRESGILFKKIREKKGLSYAQGAFQALGIDPGYITIYVLTSKENINEVKNIIFREIRSFIKKGVSSKELERSKNHLKAMRQVAMQTNAYFIFTTSLDELYGLGYNNYKDYDKNIDSVSEEDVKRVAGKFLTLDKCAIVTLEGKE